MLTPDTIDPYQAIGFALNCLTTEESRTRFLQLVEEGDADGIVHEFGGFLDYCERAPKDPVREAATALVTAPVDLDVAPTEALWEALRESLGLPADTFEQMFMRPVVADTTDRDGTASLNYGLLAGFLYTVATESESGRNMAGTPHACREAASVITAHHSFDCPGCEIVRLRRRVNALLESNSREVGRRRAGETLLGEAAKTFRFYEQCHRRKLTLVGPAITTLPDPNIAIMQKVEANQAHANIIETFLANPELRA